MIKLNDAAVRHDFNEWLPAEFFEDVADDGMHVLALAFLHGQRGGEARSDWPPHWRTLWYAEMSNGDIARVTLDIASEQLASLPEIPGSVNEDHFAGETERPIPPLIVLKMAEGEKLIDGKHIVAAAIEAGITPELPALMLDDFDDDEVEGIRASIP